MRNNKTRKLVYTGLFAALVCVVTLIHVPVGNGYIHVGDAVIYIGATILPFPFGIFAGAIGATLSDLFSGYAIYAIPTFIVKGLNAMCFYVPFKAHEKIVTPRTIMASVVSAFVTITGYLIAEWILFGKAAALGYLPRCFVQPLASTIVLVLLGTALDKARIKDRIKFEK